MELTGQKVLVWGAARSGVASSRFLVERGAIVALHDRKPLEEWPREARDLKALGVGLVAGELPSWLLDQISVLVLSPGVPRTAIPARYADRAGAEVIGEVELAARFMRGRIVAITGSNGKTTTTSLIGRLLADGGIPTQVGGNIGAALIGLAETSRDDGWTVVELSSFQLESVDRFHANVAIALNVTPNHLDRYDSLADYAAAKHRIFRNQEPSDVAVINADDSIVSSWAAGLRAHVVKISTRQELPEGLFLRGRELVSRTAEGEKVLVTRDEMLLQGLHNVENVLAALAAGLACGVAPDSMRETIKRFRPVEHRLEHSGSVRGVDFFNDSKATSVDAAVKAMEALSDRSGKIVLILGGRGKQAPYAPLAELIANHARRLILIGEDAPVIEQELSGTSEMDHATNMNDAVRLGFQAAEPGDAVLLAPACASFDMFKSFEHRGEVFKRAVQELADSLVECGQSA